MNIYEELLKRLQETKPVTLCTELCGREGLLSGLRRELRDGVTPTVDAKGRRFARVTAEHDGDALKIAEPVLPEERLIVLGAGHIALPVCEFAAKSGFSVTVIDDRPDFANRTRFPLAADVICDGFEHAIEGLRITPFDYVVIITRGHRHDADCLRAILPGEMPAYLGMIGSRRRTTGLLKMLEEEGFPAERLAKICTPIGLNIGAITPGEIAISSLS